MSAENKQLVTAADQKIAPQYYNPQTDQYEHLRGKNGASNVNVIESALPAGAATAAKQDEQTGHLEALVAKDFATDAKLDLILSKLGDIESEIEAIKDSDGIKRIDETVDVQLTGSYVEYDVAVSIWIPVGSGQRRIVGQNDRAWGTASSGAGFLPIPLEGVEKLCLSLINPSTEGTFGNFRLAFYDTLTPSRTESGAVNHIPLDINVPASGRLLLDLTPYLYAFKGLGLIYHAQSSSETAEYTFRFRAWKR